MEKTGSGYIELKVKSFEPVMVAPSLPSPKTILPLSSIDNLPLLRGNIFNSLLVYNAHHSISADPAKIIREALSKVLVYYFPFAGRLRSKENGEVEVECTGEGAVFVEAMADNSLSELGDFDDGNPSFQQLLFSLPLSTTPIENFHLLVVQVTRFTCGGFVVGVSFHHSICDGGGACQFLKGLAEMVRGEIKPSLEPIWNRELWKPEDPIKLQFYHFESIMESTHNLHQPPIIDESVQASLVIKYDVIKCIKKYFMEESKDFFSTFEVVSALAWKARTKALKISSYENVKLLFAMDMRRSVDLPLPQGYYGNAIGMGCAIDIAQDLTNGSLLRATKIIKRSKSSLNDAYLKPNIATCSCTSNMHVKQDNLLALSDWRRLGFHEVDFGWGDAKNVSSLLPMEKGLAMPDYFIFVESPKHMPDGIKILMCMPMSIVKAFETEMESMTREYMDRKV
ncbi:hypothetical protein SUGI_0880890 [Cryptomeria japonica]|uniref:taxadien-5-alpha-ol O-acetyltransferase n=1 Tax=Cryptomeria japonica TaxID=3369 RepID=UPI0024147D7A|nr:taxadien-5-alpha-ol O-acetyltransferase [Cryptomeria japonica]GLJ42497.1 hypothetical protein SUGI_0880890 [Cryptomeria japonica]